jgi:CBS domain containing-hemolysin-like protein
MAMLMAPPLMVFYQISRPFVWVIERSAAGLSHALGLRGGHGAGGHSAEELKFIVASSRHEGHLDPFAETAIKRVLELPDVNTREIMVPRVEIVSVSVNTDLDELLRIALDHQYSRLPVYESSPEHIIGILHIKDLLRAWQERKSALARRQATSPFRLRRFLRIPLVVPETKPVSQLIDEFRSERSHMAMVVDEFGTITGLVTLEDALEQVFGEIEDEHDIQRAMPAAGALLVEVDGAINIRDLASQYGIELPGDAGFETLAGFLLFQLGYIPKPGEEITYGDRVFTVAEMERNRIKRVVIKSEQPAPKSA